VDSGQVHKGPVGVAERRKAGSGPVAGLDNGQWTVDRFLSIQGWAMEMGGGGVSRGRVGQVERFPKRPAEAVFHKIECYSPCL
jgi:hypothetical protein